VALVLSAPCLGRAAEQKNGGLSGAVGVDGSSTVFPITEAVAEEFHQRHPHLRVMVGIAGTGGGFERFVRGETDINDASRPIKESEAAQAAKNAIAFIELPVAFDGLTVVTNRENDFVDFLTVEELRKIWQHGSTVKKWSDVRPGWPDRPLKLYGPGTDSGTFDYFTEAVNGKAGACRADFSASEDDNVLVQGVAGDRDALGYFGYAYYVANSARLRVVPVDGGAGPVTPSGVTINDGTYRPLSRPLFIYVSESAAKRPEVEEFVRFYLASAAALAKEVGYTPLPDEIYGLALDRFRKRRAGSAFLGKATVGLSLKDVLAREK